MEAMAIYILPFTLFIFFTFSTGASLYIPGGIEDDEIQWGRLADMPSDTSTHVVDNSSLLLAAERTLREDPLNGFRLYRGGWNISDPHYWTSVAYTGVPIFIIAAVWFVVFALVMLCGCFYHCCCSTGKYSNSPFAYGLSLVLLIIFTLSAIIGSIVLYTGQTKFHTSTTSTLDYVVKQANFTVENLRNFSYDLSDAKKVGLFTWNLSHELQNQIDMLVTKVNSSANMLDKRVSENYEEIHFTLDRVGRVLIVVTAVMLVLVIIGFSLSICGVQYLVYVFVFLGWILVAGTFILCGIFLFLHNVVGDTCVSMQEWASNPHARTALDAILPCVDVNVASDALATGSLVIFGLVDFVNKIISAVANNDEIPHDASIIYYNQSGPSMPKLCNPYHPDLSNRPCATGEVNLENAPQVWQNYACTVSSIGICRTPGRLTPILHNQLSAAANAAYGVYHYGPFLAQLVDCTFVRKTFSTINVKNCPGLGKYTKWTYVGLALASTAVMLSLIFWLIYVREQKHRRYGRGFIRM